MCTNYSSIKHINGSPLFLGISTFFTQFTKLSSLMCVVHQSDSSLPESLLPIALALGFIHLFNNHLWGIPGGSDGKESTCNAGDLGSILGLGRSPGGGHGNPLQYSCLEKPMDRGARQAMVHWVAKS